MMSTLQTLTPCQKCGTRYHDHKSTASLRLTYCSALCEQLDLGFTIADLLKPTTERNTP